MTISARDPTTFFRTKNVRRTGFTLIEMLLVVTFIGIVSTGVAVSLNGRQEEHALRVAAQDLAQALRFAAGEAQVLQRPCRVAFNEELTRYRVQAWDEDAGEFVALHGRGGLEREILATVKLDDPASPAKLDDPASPATAAGVLDPAGTAAATFGSGASATRQLTLRSRNGRSATITIIFASGQVHVQY